MNGPASPCCRSRAPQTSSSDLGSEHRPRDEALASLQARVPMSEEKSPVSRPSVNSPRRQTRQLVLVVIFMNIHRMSTQRQGSIKGKVVPVFPHSSRLTPPTSGHWRLSHRPMASYVAHLAAPVDSYSGGGNTGSLVHHRRQAAFRVRLRISPTKAWQLTTTAASTGPRVLYAYDE